MQRQGIEAAEAALAAGEATAMLVLKAHDQRTAELCSAARDAGIPVHEVTERDMWRMAWPGSEEPPTVLTLVGRKPEAQNLDELTARGGLLLCLDGVSYAGNMGFSVRTAEVAGATGVVSLEKELRRSWVGHICRCPRLTLRRRRHSYDGFGEKVVSVGVHAPATASVHTQEVDRTSAINTHLHRAAARVEGLRPFVTWHESQAVEMRIRTDRCE